MNLFLIDKNENVIGVVPDGNIIDLTQSIEINQADVLNGTITLDKSLRLDEVRYFAVPDRDNPHNLWMYRKTVVKVENDDIIIQGVNAFYDDLKAYGYIKDKRPNAINAEQAVRLIIGNTRWNVDFVDASLNSSNAEIHGINFYYLTYLDAIKAIEDTWTIEIQPFINIEGNKITRKYINLYQQMGGNKGKRFVYGENTLQIVKESNDTDVYTALIGRGAGVAEQDDQGNDTGGFSRKITFADVEWSKAKGAPVDKPLGQEWVEWPQATKKFGYSDGTPRFGIVEFQNEEDPTNLLKETWDNLKKSAIPSVQFSATVGNVGFLSLGETVAIVRYDLDIKYQTRVTKIDWNRKNEKASQITLGDKLVQSAADRYRSVQAEAYKARDIADQAAGQANFAIDNGGTTIQWGSNEPAHPKEGDLWYDKQPDGTVVMKQYVNGQWIILIDDTTGEQIKNKVDKAEENVKQLKTDTDNAQAEINGKLATNDVKLTHFNDGLTATDKKVDGLQGQITEVDNKATDIKNTADSAATIANDAMSSIQQAVANASSDAAKIRSDVAKVQNEINTVKTANSTQIKQNKKEIDLKANQDTVNNLTGEVSKNKAQLKVQAGQISSKVSSEAFKMLDNKVGGAIAQIDKNATAIDQTDKKISLKADQTEVDNVKSTASQNSSQIQLMANEIKSKVTSTDVDNIVNSKGYATTNTVQSLVTQKADQWNLNLTNLKTDVNAIKMTGGGVNLLTGTGTASGDVANGDGIFAQGAFNGYDAVRTNRAYRERYINLYQSLGITNAKAGDWYTISVYVKADKQIDTGSLDVYRALGNVDANTNDGHLDGILMQDKPITTQWQQYSWSFQINNISLQRQTTRVEYSSDTGDNWIYWAGWVLEKGSVAHDWSPAPSDMATVTSVTNLSATVDGIKSTVANKADQSTVTQLSNVIQSKVSNADYQSKITELANGINSTVKKTDFDNLSKAVELQTLDSADINNMRTNGHYFVHNLANTPIQGWVYVDVVGNNNDRIRQDVYRDQDNQHCYRSWNDSWWTDWSKGATETQITQLSDSIQTKVSNADYQSKITELADAIQSKVSSSNFDNLSKTVELQTLDSADINNMRTNGHYFVHNLANTPIQGWVYVDVVGNGNNRIRQDVYQDIGNQHCYRRWNDSWWTDWSQGATESEINQLSDNINLRVQKNDVINQINISPEGILIDGSRTHITGKTVIDNAAIRDAAISNLSASKLTAGVINCREIDVMNISGYQILANQITADKMAANAIMVGLNNSLTNLSINPYGFNITENGRNVLAFNKTGMRVSDPENNEQIGWIHANHMNDAHWFNGLALDVDDAGDYVGFGSHNSSTNFYDVKFAYYKNKYQSHEADTLVSSVPFEFNNGELRHGGATLEFRNSWLEGKWNLPTLGRGPSYIMFGDTDVFVVINKTRYSMNDVIHSIGRGKTWN